MANNRDIIYKIGIEGFSRLQELERLEISIKNNILAIDKAQRNIKNPDFVELRKQLSEVNREYKVVERSVFNYITSQNSAKGSSQGLKAELALLKDAYSKLGAEEQKLAAGKKLESSIKSTAREVAAATKALKVHVASFADYRGAVNSFSTNLFSVFNKNATVAKAGLTGLATGVVSALAGNTSLAWLEIARAVGKGTSEIIKFNAQLADAEADVSKTANLSLAQVQALTQELKGIDTRTPIIELLKIGEVLGRLGVEVTPKVIESMDKLKVALSDEFGNNAEKITESVGKLKTLFTEFNGTTPEEAYLKIGNALNVLAASGASTAPVITEFSKRIAGTVGSLGLTASEILGVSATLEELGTTAYRGSSGFARVIMEITKAPEAFSSALGITQDTVKEFTGSALSFTELINKDLYSAFTVVLSRIREMNLSTTEQAALFDKLKINGQSETEVLNKLQVSQDLLASRVSLANKSLQNQNSIISEFSKKNKNLAGELSQLGNNLQEVFISSGLQNYLAKTVDSINSMFVATRSLTSSLGEEQSQINALSIGILGLNDNRELQIQRINELKVTYPSYFENLKTDKAETSLLLNEIFNLNDNRELQVQKIAQLKREHPDYIRNLQQDKTESGQLLAKLLDLNTTNEERTVILTKLKAGFPDLFTAITKETDLTNQLKASLDGVNEAYNKRRYSAQLREDIIKDTKTRAESALTQKSTVETTLIKNLSLPLGTYGKQLGVDFKGSTLETAKSLLAANAAKGGIIPEDQVKNIERGIRLLEEFNTKAINTDKAFKNAISDANKATEGIFNDEISRTQGITTILENSLNDYIRLQKEYEKAKASGNSKRGADEIIKELKQLDANVTTLVSDNSVKLVKDIQDPSARVASLIASLNKAEAATKNVSNQIKNLNKGTSLGGEEFDASSLITPKKSRKVGTSNVPSDNAFDNAFKNATIQGDDYRKKYLDYLDKLNRDIEEASIRGEANTFQRQAELITNSTNDKAAQIRLQTRKVLEEYQQGYSKYADAIKIGEEYIAKLKNTKAASPEVQSQINKEIVDSKAHLAELKTAQINLQNEFFEDAKILEEKTTKEIGLQYEALATKIEELRKKFASKYAEDFVKEVNTKELSLTNGAVDNTTQRLFALELKRLADNKAILTGEVDKAFNESYLKSIGLDKSFDIQSSLNGKLSGKQKRKALLKADRLNDAAELKIKSEGLEEKLTIQQSALDSLVKQNALSLVLPTIFNPIPPEAIEQQKKQVESTRKEITSILKAQGEKETSINRSDLEERAKQYEQYKKQVKGIFEDLAESFIKSQLDIEAAKIQEAYDTRIALLDKEFAYKESLYVNDAANLKRLEREKAAEKLKIDKQYAEDQRKLAIRQAEIDTALAIFKAYSQLGPIGGSIATVGLLALLAVQLKTIKAKKYAKGGFVDGENAPPDETGQSPVPIIAHAGEFVVPTYVVKNPRGRKLISEIQGMMSGGNKLKSKGLYADGGSVVLPTSSSLNYQFKVVEASISTKSINELKDAVYDAVNSGASDGTLIGNQDYLRLAERRDLAAKLSTI